MRCVHCHKTEYVRLMRKNADKTYSCEKCYNKKQLRDFLKGKANTALEEINDLETDMKLHTKQNPSGIHDYNCRMVEQIKICIEVRRAELEIVNKYICQLDGIGGAK